MNIQELIDILLKAKEEGIERVEVKKTHINPIHRGPTHKQKNFYRYDDIDGIVIDRDRNSVVLDLDGL